MPIYEYECRECEKRFEMLVFASESAGCLVCPRCGARDPRRLISLFGLGRGSADSMVPSSGSACNTCSSKNCSSCH